MALEHHHESRNKVAQIQNRLNQTIEDIRNSKVYSPEGRRAEMAKATLAARREAAALKSAYVAGRETRRESLEKSLFGLTGEPTPTDLMVMRDSRDRAAALEGEADAQLKLQLANQAGDTFMAKAIAQVAAVKGWTSIVESYAETAPLGTRTALEELTALPSGTNTRLADSAVFAIRAPAELHAKDDRSLEHLVAQAETQMATRNGRQYDVTGAATFME